MAVPVIMPRQGQSVETCIITRWLRKKGDPVKKGDILFSYETDKASFDVEAETDGILLDVFAPDGAEVAVLTNVAVIGKAGEDISALLPGAAAPEGKTAATQAAGTGAHAVETTTIAEPVQERRIRISPRARVMARKLGINTAGVTGTGPNGRIIAQDIESASGKPETHPVESRDDGLRVTPSHAVPAGVAFVDKKLSHVRKIIARAMHDSISSSAQLTHHLSADVRKLLALRNQVKEGLEKGGTLNITLNDMISFAVIRALEKFPEVNSHFLGESIRTFSKVHLGMAVDTPRGLMVPAIRNASDYSLKGLSDRLRETAEQCRKGNIDPELLASTSASFTVSNLGNYGVEMFTPIINLPQAAILGVNTILYRPADLGNGTFGFIPVIGLSLTYDHRAIDGGPATLFLKEIKMQIENFEEKI